MNIRGPTLTPTHPHISHLTLLKIPFLTQCNSSVLWATVLWMESQITLLVRSREMLIPNLMHDGTLSSPSRCDLPRVKAS